MTAFKPPMRIVFLWVGLLLALSTLVAASSYEPIEVLTGDSFEARDENNKKVTIRLAGIDAPKGPLHEGGAGQPFHEQAARHLAALVPGPGLKLISYGYDSSGRILAVVYANDKNINLEMVRDGYAEVYRGRPVRGLDLAPYWEAEKQAHDAKRGMWVQGERYVSPRKWIGTQAK
jgi:micrococcal nuclease